MERRDFIRGGALALGTVIVTGQSAPNGCEEEDPPPTTTSSTTTSSTTTSTSTTTTTTTTAPPSPPAKFSGDVSLPAGFTVPAGETWAFDPNVSTTVRVRANVIVEGTLAMRPASPAVTHRLIFEGVNEAGFVGGDTQTPIASDVGLWIVGQGRLDVQGAAKVPWTRAVGALAAGATSFDVEGATGWQVGDQIVITPTVPRSVSGYWTKYDRRRITAIAGNTVTVDSPLTNPHPARTVSGETFTAEVLNLTRNAVIEGTPTGRAHVIFLHQGHATFQQLGLGYLELRHLAPAKNGAGVAGRYALHYHHSHGTTAGAIVDGVSVHDCGGHSFVAHQSDGITFRQCVSDRTAEGAYWWDPGEISDDVIYDRCVASAVETFTGPDRFTSVGFFLNRTSAPLASKCVGCVAVGIDGTSDPNGFFWNNGSVGVWTFQDCLAHNIRDQGIRVWQNSNEQMHPLDRFRAYSCGRGIDHGAYSNSYRYHDLKIDDCGTGIVQRAISHEGGQEWHDVFVTGCPTPLVIGDAPVSSLKPIDFRRSPFGTVRVNADHAGTEVAWWDFTDCGLEPADFQIVAMVGPCRLRTQDGGVAWQRTESSGWVQIPAF